MTSFKIIAAAFILSAAAATPVLAQAAIQEPGAYAFYHPNGDVLGGSMHPAPEAFAPMQANNSMARMHMDTRHVRHGHAIRAY